MQQLHLFGFPEPGEPLPTNEFVEINLPIALTICRMRPYVTIDDIRPHLRNPPIEPRDYGVLMKAVERAHGARKTGIHLASKRPECNGRPLRVWQTYEATA